MEQIKKSLPEGVAIEPFMDRTKLVDKAIGTVGKNLLEGALIVIFILVLLLGNLRAGLVVASVIPLSLLFAVTMMNLFGVSGNLMSLGAIDFGSHRGWGGDHRGGDHPSFTQWQGWQA
jgi:cobalt-zinc-cadmium resistance protein CzcA